MLKPAIARQLNLPLALAFALGVGALAPTAARAGSYAAIDLTPGAVNAQASGISGDVAAGFMAPAAVATGSRAMVWGVEGAVDLHPGFLVDAATGNAGRSVLEGSAAGIQVGAGAGVSTLNRSLPMVWRGTAESAAFLASPFPAYSGSAQATDGSQIVGNVTAFQEDGITLGVAHAVVWDASTGVATDLGGGKGAMAYGVGGGVQVGFVNKAGANAALWRGSEQSMTLLHPRGAIVSVANATDGVRQVGYAGFDVRVRREAAKGNKDARFNYAYAWSGSAATARNIHAGMAVNGVTPFAHSYALGLSGATTVGYAVDATRTGTPAAAHAIVWDENDLPTDLNAFLPAGFVGAVAYAVDANGQIAGAMMTADGKRHAVVWVPTEAAAR